MRSNISGRIDISRLRKDKGMSQVVLARKLEVAQSFLSNVENGKNRLPSDKIDRLKEIFQLESLDAYMMESARTRNIEQEAPAETSFSEGDLFNRLLNRFHEQAHRHDEESHNFNHERLKTLEESNNSLLRHNERLMERNDRLTQRNEELREEIERLREENFKLRHQ